MEGLKIPLEMAPSQDFEMPPLAGRSLTKCMALEVRERFLCRTDTSDWGGCYFFINHHQPNAAPPVPAIRSNSHHPSAA
jgi:hypothetical protein